MTLTFLSRFTPSLMSPAELEALLVQREELVARTLGLIADSVEASAAHHVLFVGPRGIGKTHLVSILFHRLSVSPLAPDRLLLAWLREDEWGVASFLDVLLRILRVLPASVVGPSVTDVDNLYQLTAEEAEARAASLLLKLIGPRSLVVIVENLDEVFAGLGEDGQRRLRAFLQEHPQVSVVATAQSLFAGVSRQVAPFYGFFHTQHLAELSLEEATSLLGRIAALEGNTQLSAFLQTAMGRARVRAVHHLAGGNHRVYVILSAFLTRESLDEFVGPLLRMLDDLTPYYQARMSWLSAQQRKLVEILCDFRRAATVRELATRAFITQQTASAQLKILRERGYVTAQQSGRESYYDLREPLMRLCIEVKKERARPVKMLLDFLRLWYTPVELSQRLESLHDGARLEREYVTRALEDESISTDPRVAACLADHENAMKAGRFVAGLQAAEELVAIRGNIADRLNQTHALIHLRRWEEAERVCAEVLRDSSDRDAWAFLAQALVGQGKADEAIKALTRATELAPHDVRALEALGLTYCRLRRHDEELAVAVRLTEVEPESVRAWINRATAASEARRKDDVSDAYETVIRLAPERPEGWIGKAELLLDRDDPAGARGVLAKVNEQRIADAPTRVHYARVLRHLGDPKAALAVIDRAPRGERYSRLMTERSRAFEDLQRLNEAVAAAEEATKLNEEDHSAWHQLGQVQMSVGHYREALEAVTKAHDLGDRCRVVLFDLAASLAALSRWTDALQRLDEGFIQAAGDGPYKYEAATFLKAVFEKSDPLAWPSAIAGVLEVFERHGAAAELSTAIVKPVATGLRGGNERATAWLEAWRQLGGGRSIFEIPLRLLNAAVRYREEKDDKPLLELPMEERRLLASLLGLDLHEKRRVTATAVRKGDSSH